MAVIDAEARFRTAPHKLPLLFELGVPCVIEPVFVERPLRP
jgi:hypothetical protein